MYFVALVSQAEEVLSSAASLKSTLMCDLRPSAGSSSWRGDRHGLCGEVRVEALCASISMACRTARLTGQGIAPGLPYCGMQF
jgi:hypothetical protein